MKTASLILITALGLATVPQASAQQLKIGTVDMKKVFDGYYKTKDAESKINEQRNAAKKELEDRMDVAKKTLDEVKKLDDDLQNPALSKEEKDRKAKLRSDKATELQNMDREIREFQATREKQLQEQSMRMRAGIVDDIDKVVADRVKAESYNLVFDKSGPSLNGVPIVLFSMESYDFTNEVVSILNKNRNRDESSTTHPALSDASTPKPVAGSGGRREGSGRASPSPTGR